MIIFMIVIVIIMIMVLFLYMIVMMMMIITCDAWTAFWDTLFLIIIIAIRTPSWETHLTSLDLSLR